MCFIVLDEFIAPASYNKEHIDFIQKMTLVVQLFSVQVGGIFGIKDVNSRHIIATNAYAKIVGLNVGTEVTGKLESEMPCPNVGEYVEQFISEDQTLLGSLDVNKSIETLNIHNYNDGLKARKFIKKALHDEATKSILGIIFLAHDVDIKEIIQLLPSYFATLDTASGKNTTPQNVANNTQLLNDYEQEICFLILLQWDFKQIAKFMNIHRPDHTSRTANTIIKKKTYICQKLSLKCNDINILH